MTHNVHVLTILMRHNSDKTDVAGQKSDEVERMQLMWALQMIPTSRCKKVI